MNVGKRCFENGHKNNDNYGHLHVNEFEVSNSGKRPEFIIREGVILHYNNSKPHTSLMTQLNLK